MGRKRKVAASTAMNDIDEEDENHSQDNPKKARSKNIAIKKQMNIKELPLKNSPLLNIMLNAQTSDTFHKKYIKDLRDIYVKMDHQVFFKDFCLCLMAAMSAEETNENSQNLLKFCAALVSSYNEDEEHPLMRDTFSWLLGTISNNPFIRFRLCEFVNLILDSMGYQAALDDNICDNILTYMLNRVHDAAPSVRVQAIKAMQRLQIPDNVEDPVVRAYQFHLSADPSPRVRQTIISCIGRNYHTIPYIIERLWDVDEKVRRHTYLEMSSLPVRSYKVSWRLKVLEQGLNERSETVRKVVHKVFLQHWLDSYDKNPLHLLMALKMDSNKSDMDRFRDISKQMLNVVFQQRRIKAELISYLPLTTDDEFHHCIPYDKLTVEVSLYWCCLSEYFQSSDADEYDQIVPELSGFCSYIERYCQLHNKEMDSFQNMEFQYILLSLMEMLCIFDLGDEIGRGNLQNLMGHLLNNFRLDENVIKVIVRCVENLIPEQSLRLQFFVDIVQDICNLKTKKTDFGNSTVINELIAKSTDACLNLKLSRLKVQLLDLQEQETMYMEKKDYDTAHKITEEKQTVEAEYSRMIQPLLEEFNAANSDSPLRVPLVAKTVTSDNILKSLHICYHMVVSEKVTALNPSACKLYNDFICLHMASNQIEIRDWALKCGSAFSLLYETLARDVFQELYSQFFKNQIKRLWETSIICLFELLDRYGISSFFVAEPTTSQNKRTGRQLYNTLSFLDTDDDASVSSSGQNTSVIDTMVHLLEKCEHTSIKCAIIKGFCRLVLRGRIHRSNIMEKLLLCYFDPTTDSGINQIIGLFLQNLIMLKKQSILQSCLLPTLHAIKSATYDSTLKAICPSKVTRFVIDATRKEISDANKVSNSTHQAIAESFLKEMVESVSNKDHCKLLSKELLLLEIKVDEKPEAKATLHTLVDKLLELELDAKIAVNLSKFKEIIEGITQPNDEQQSEEENGSVAESATNTELSVEQINRKTPQTGGPVIISNELLIPPNGVEADNIENVATIVNQNAPTQVERMEVIEEVAEPSTMPVIAEQNSASDATSATAAVEEALLPPLSTTVIVEENPASDATSATAADEEALLPPLSTTVIVEQTPASDATSATAADEEASLPLSSEETAIEQIEILDSTPKADGLAYPTTPTTPTSPPPSVSTILESTPVIELSIALPPPDEPESVKVPEQQTNAVLPPPTPLHLSPVNVTSTSSHPLSPSTTSLASASASASTSKTAKDAANKITKKNTPKQVTPSGRRSSPKVVAEISPSSSIAPMTFYGRNNETGPRHLRRSLQTPIKTPENRRSPNKATSTSTIRQKQTQSKEQQNQKQQQQHQQQETPRIRIEVRIDSDKKVKNTVMPSVGISRARRNLAAEDIAQKTPTKRTNKKTNTQKIEVVTGVRNLRGVTTRTGKVAVEVANAKPQSGSAADTDRESVQSPESAKENREGHLNKIAASPPKARSRIKDPEELTKLVNGLTESPSPPGKSNQGKTKTQVKDVQVTNTKTRRGKATESNTMSKEKTSQSPTTVAAATSPSATREQPQVGRKRRSSTANCKATAAVATSHLIRSSSSESESSKSPELKRARTGIRTSTRRSSVASKGVASNTEETSPKTKEPSKTAVGESAKNQQSNVESSKTKTTEEEVVTATPKTMRGSRLLRGAGNSTVAENRSDTSTNKQPKNAKTKASTAKAQMSEQMSEPQQVDTSSSTTNNNNSTSNQSKSMLSTPQSQISNATSSKQTPKVVRTPKANSFSSPKSSTRSTASVLSPGGSVTSISSVSTRNAALLKHKQSRILTRKQSICLERKNSYNSNNSRFEGYVLSPLRPGRKRALESESSDDKNVSARKQPRPNNSTPKKLTLLATATATAMATTITTTSTGTVTQKKSKIPVLLKKNNNLMTMSNSGESITSTSSNSATTKIVRKATGIAKNGTLAVVHVSSSVGGNKPTHLPMRNTRRLVAKTR